MWITTQTGFISAVQKKPEDTKLTVRSRDKLSLVAVCRTLGVNDSRIKETTDTDYEFRMLLTREQLSTFLTAQVDAVDYSNFKNRITRTRGKKWHDACMDVWFAMLNVSRTRPFYRHAS